MYTMPSVKKLALVGVILIMLSIGAVVLLSISDADGEIIREVAILSLLVPFLIAIFVIALDYSDVSTADERQQNDELVRINQALETYVQTMHYLDEADIDDEIRSMTRNQLHKSLKKILMDNEELKETQNID